MIVTVDWRAPAPPPAGASPAPALAPPTATVGSTNAEPGGWYWNRIPSCTSTSILSPAAISSSRFTAGGTLVLSLLPPSRFTVRLRGAGGTASHGGVNFCERGAAAPPGGPAARPPR